MTPSLNSQASSFQAKNLELPILSEIFGKIPFGRVILGLYDTDSQFSALMVNIAAEQLKANGNLLYLSSFKPTPELRQQFNNLGVNVAEHEAKDDAVLNDAYSAQAGVKSNEKYHFASPNLNDISIAVTQSAPQWPAGTLVVVEYFSAIAMNQESVFAKFSRKVAGVWRAQGSIMIAGLALDTHPSPFYSEMKLIVDGVFELKLIEHKGEMVNAIRSRSLRGQLSDTRWRKVLFDEKMKASLQLLEQPTG